MQSSMSEIRFCYCGRIADYGLRCKKHKDKALPEPKKKVGRYSGYSKSFNENHGSEAVSELN